MSEERFRELWAKVEHIGKIEHLSDDALLALGGIFGELKSKINEQAERAQKNAQDLEDMDRQLYSEQQQNKRYREALEEILEEAYEEAGIHPDTGMQLETYIVKIARKALEGEK